MYGTLGDIVFEVIGGPESFTESRRYNYPEHRVVEDRPKLQWIGNELRAIEIKLKFHMSFTNPTVQRDLIYATADAHQALPLALSNGEYVGMFVITAVDTVRVQDFSDGTPLALEMRLTLKEWVQDIEVDPGAPPQPATPPIGVAPTPTSGATSTLSPSAGAAAIAAPSSTSVIVNPVTGAQVVVFESPLTGASALTSNPAPGGASGPRVQPDDVPTSTITRS